MGVRLGDHRRFLFRTYLILLVGVVLIAVLLEVGLNLLDRPPDESIDPWVEKTLALIEDHLVKAESYDDSVAALEDVIDVPITMLSPTDIASMPESTTGTRRLVDDAGRIAFLHFSDDLPEVIYLGPVDPAPNNSFFDWAPTVYYLLVFALIGFWIHPLLRDIETISVAAERFSQDYRSPTRTQDKTTELTTLAAQVDAMSLRLSGLIQSQKELIAAMSHEMRTPLTRLRFAIAMRQEQTDSAAYPSISSIQQDLDEIEALTAAMLEFARLDHPDLALNRESITVDTLLAAIDLRPINDNVEIDVESDPAMTLHIDVRLMTLAISNLLTNAQRHARSRVVVRLRKRPDASLIQIEDDGEGIPESERETVFKAFTRLDESRTRNTGGFGLGLAVVARIASLHGGSANVDASPELGGARFTIQW
ncbi:MAG: ATP-binding protein [Pseudomonadota bacterium]